MDLLARLHPVVDAGLYVLVFGFLIYAILVVARKR